MNEEPTELKSLAEAWKDIEDGLTDIPPPLISMLRTTFYSGAFAHANCMYVASKVGKQDIIAAQDILNTTRRELIAFREELHAHL